MRFAIPFVLLAATALAVPTPVDVDVTPEPVDTYPAAATTTAPACGYRCEDHINECGKWFGGCYDTCVNEFSDLFSAPPCEEAPVYRL
ncbi:hypothetical protein PVAG01_03809 [Phlyctema vagabunda]|uniref:Uncharacterized protein n=1 Tax=Phlyctema vagabunda TaxID=108571 RepID=A0ABR4PMG1_9HELO